MASSVSLSPFSLRLQNGFPGGFAPSVPNQIITINTSADTALRITSAVRPDGASVLQDAFAPKSISASDAHTASLLDELAGLLRALPSANPPGVQDFYGLDTTITFEGRGLRWSNKVDKSCRPGSTATRWATDEQKAQFRRAVRIVGELERKEA